jgi:signal transduction histidine kinase
VHRRDEGLRPPGNRLRWTGALLLVLLLAGVHSLTYFLYGEARAIVQSGLASRLEAIGRAAQAALALPALREPSRLRRYLADLRREAGLENVLVAGPDFRSLADARPAIPPGKRYDLLELDGAAFRAARSGAVRVAEGSRVEDLRFLGAYFPAPEVAPGAVLYLESPVEYLEPLRELKAALLAAAGLSVALVLVLAVAWLLAQRAMARARAAVARAQRLAALGEMAAKVAHEIRNPLAIIRGSAELWREEAGAGAADRVSVILDEVGRLDDLVGDFLSLARESPLARSPVDLVALAQEVATRFSASQSQGSVVQVTRETAALVVLGDAARLRQVLVNLLRNAREASPGGNVEIRLRREGGDAVLRVRDDGPGVPPEVGERLFEPFFSTKPGGTGLGLAVSRQIALRHGGSLSLVAAQGPGAVFELRIPIG